MKHTLKPGLVSITFRHLSVPMVVDLARNAGLRGIEWGGDMHAPHGDVRAARKVAAMTRDAGLAVAAYGSYYRLDKGAKGPAFEEVLASAKALGAPLIRVWAGSQASAACDDAAFKAVAGDALRVAAMAQAEGMRVGLEYHADTLTDSAASARRLWQAAEHPALLSFWQPPNGLSKDGCEEGLRDLVQAGRLGSLHVFHWWPDAATRLPLDAGAARWKDYLALAAQAPGERYCCLEFVANDEPAQLLHDAQVLKAWLAELDQAP